MKILFYFCFPRISETGFSHLILICALSFRSVAQADSANKLLLFAIYEQIFELLQANPWKIDETQLLENLNFLEHRWALASSTPGFSYFGQRDQLDLLNLPVRDHLHEMCNPIIFDLVVLLSENRNVQKPTRRVNPTSTLPQITVLLPPISILVIQPPLPNPTKIDCLKSNHSKIETRKIG